MKPTAPDRRIACVFAVDTLPWLISLSLDREAVFHFHLLGPVGCTYLLIRISTPAAPIVMPAPLVVEWRSMRTPF